MRAEGCGRTLGSAVRAGESGGLFCARDWPWRKASRQCPSAAHRPTACGTHAHAQGVGSGPRGGDRALSPGRGFVPKQALGGGARCAPVFCALVIEAHDLDLLLNVAGIVAEGGLRGARLGDGVVGADLVDVLAVARRFRVLRGGAASAERSSSQLAAGAKARRERVGLGAAGAAG